MSELLVDRARSTLTSVTLPGFHAGRTRRGTRGRAPGRTGEKVEDSDRRHADPSVTVRTAVALRAPERLHVAGSAVYLGRRSRSPEGDSTSAVARGWSGAARAGAAAMLGMDAWDWEDIEPWPAHVCAILRLVRGRASSTGRRADASGHSSGARGVPRRSAALAGVRALGSRRTEARARSCRPDGP